MADESKGPLQGQSGAPLVIRQGAYLPHWTREGRSYFLTFRLGDSLPAHVLENWRIERWHIVARAQQMGRALSYAEEERLRELFSERVETWLDRGAGECLLKDERVARLVRDAILHFDGDRYGVHAWCIMPNHAHVVAPPHPGHELSDILHSWKSFTSHQANQILGRKGSLWQTEYYDHLVRDDAQLRHYIWYTLQNPSAAGMEGWPRFGYGSLIRDAGEQPMGGTPMPHSQQPTGGTPVPHSRQPGYE